MVLNFISHVVGNLLRGQWGLPEHRGGGLDFLGGAVRAGGRRDTSPSLVGAGGGVEWIEIQTSLESDTRHRYTAEQVIVGFTHGTGFSAETEFSSEIKSGYERLVGCWVGEK